MEVPLVAVEAAVDLADLVVAAVDLVDLVVAVVDSVVVVVDSMEATVEDSVVVAVVAVDVSNGFRIICFSSFPTSLNKMCK